MKREEAEDDPVLYNLDDLPPQDGLLVRKRDLDEDHAGRLKGQQEVADFKFGRLGLLLVLGLELFGVLAFGLRDVFGVGLAAEENEAEVGLEMELLIKLSLRVRTVFVGF